MSKNNLFSSRKRKGFSLIEMLVFIFIFSLTALTFYKLFMSGTQVIISVKNRLAATALANERIEVIHNLNYEKIGTIGGVPNGEIPQDETVDRSGKTYYVHTSVIYIDNPFDGSAQSGSDERPNDYKQIKVIVFWEENNPASSVTLVSNISPPGMEAIYTGGILSLNVMDDTDVVGGIKPISQARVIIKNNSVSPAVNLDLTTDNEGNIFLPEASVSDQGYSIEISKAGFFPVKTYAPYPISTVYPVDVHKSVSPAQINQYTITTSKLSNINLFTKNPYGDVLSDVQFSLTGGRKIADTVEAGGTPSKPVYALVENALSSGVDGKKVFSDVSGGKYYFSLDDVAANSNFEFLFMSPLGDLQNDFSVPADTTVNPTVILAQKDVDSLLVNVKDSIDGSPIENAQVNLKKIDPAYDETITTNKFGQAFFPGIKDAISAGEYSLSISASGFQDVSDEKIDIDKFVKKDSSLVPN
jgi:type II secretory pathway pseudopilin PulG